MMQAKALWHESPETSALREEALSATLPEAFVLLKSLFSMISSGTERLVAQAGVPDALVEKMAVPYQQGTLALPVNYGYSLVGEVITPGHRLSGKKVHLLHPHKDFCQVHEKDLFLIPDGVPLARATLASNLETVVNAVWDSGVSMGDRLLVAGLGNVGAMLLLCLSQFPGVEIAFLDKQEARRQWAESQGFIPFSPQKSKPFDIAFHCTGNEVALQQCIDAVGFEGKVIELSWYGEKDISIRLGGSFHQERKQLISSQVSHLPPLHQSRWDFTRRKELVFKLLKNPVFDQLPTKIYPFEAAPDLFDSIRKAPQNLPMVNIFAYNS